MRKFFIILGMLCLFATSVNAAKIPQDVENYLKNEVRNVDIRFDGVITFPSNTIYLPLFPSLFSDIKELQIKKTYPEGRHLLQEPDIIIFNNDFVLLKVLSDGEGHRTVAHLTNPPLEVRTGLLPQDMLVPSGLIIPENIKSIKGNLKIDTKNEDIIRVENEDSYENFLSKGETNSSHSLISQLKNKILFVTTNYSKNIQVVEPAKSVPSYSLAQKSIPIDAKAVNNGKFLIVTTYERPYVDIISIADSRFIKQVSLGSNPEQILLDEKNNKAYITSPLNSTIFVLDLKTMSLIQKIKINGYCEHLLLTEDKMFYVDKLKNEIWAIELNNDYQLRDIGTFPNVSALAFMNNRLYIASRTKSRIAIIDYSTLGLVNEFTTVNKPIALLSYKDSLFILGAQNNDIEVYNVVKEKVTDTIKLPEGGFSTGLKKLDIGNYAIVNDLKHNMYSIIDLDSSSLLKTYSLNVPIKDVIITEKVRLFD